MDKKQLRQLFTAAAIYNIVVALFIFFALGWFIEMFQVGALASQPIFAHLFAMVVLSFGVMYYLIGVEPADKRFVIKSGMYAKLGVVVVCLVNTLLGFTSWQINIPAMGDIIFAYLFYRALRSPLISTGLKQ